MSFPRIKAVSHLIGRVRSQESVIPLFRACLFSFPFVSHFMGKTVAATAIENPTLSEEKYQFSAQTLA